MKDNTGGLITQKTTCDYLLYKSGSQVVFLFRQK